MTLQELAQKLVLQGGQITLGHGALDASFDDLLARCGDSPIVISQAALSQEDGAIVVTGTSSLSTIANFPVPVRARFAVDPAGALSVQLRYTLREGAPPPAAWVFTRSFPRLPALLNHRAARSQVMLDALDLFDTAFVVTNRAGHDPALGAPLSPGINFVSRVRPQGMLGVFEHAATAVPALVLHGVIILPRSGDLVAPLQPLEHPWDRLSSTTAPAPAGIYLQAALDLGCKAGKLMLDRTRLWLYSPISIDWMADNPSFEPTQGFTGTLTVPGADIQVELGADTQWGVSQALLYANCQGLALGKLGDLIDLPGGGLLEQLPSELRRPIEALGRLELLQIGLDLIAFGGAPELRSVACTIGLPGLLWHLWKDDLVARDLSVRFIVSGSAVLTTVSGVVEVGGVPLAISASSGDGFTVRAANLEPISLPLAGLLKRHAPGIPLPSPLRVTHLQAVVSRGTAFSMEALLAGDPDPWTLPLGKKTLTIADVTLWFNRAASGEVSGMFSGRIAISDGITLQATYAIPGDFLIRGTLPSIRLSRVIDRLCDQPVKLPKGFDVVLSYAAILIQEQQGGLRFQLMTEVPGLGILAFEAREVGGGTWGFACGIDLLGGKPSAVAGLSALGGLEKRLNLQKFMLVASSLAQPGFQFPDSAQFQSPQLATRRVTLPGGGGVTAGLSLYAQWTLDGGDKQHQLLRKLLGLGDVLDVTIQVGEDPANNARLYFGGSSKLQGQPFRYQVGVQMDSGSPALFLTGSVTVKIQKQPQTFDLTALFVSSGLSLSANMRGGAPLDCGPFKLANLGLEVGVDWSGLPALGVTGTIAAGRIQSAVAVFFDPSAPDKSLVAGAVSDLTLKDIVDTLLGGPVRSPIDDVLDTIAVRGTSGFALPAEVASALDQRDLEAVAAAFLKAGNVQLPTTSGQLLLCVNSPGKRWHLTDLSKMRQYTIMRSGQALQASLEAQFYFAPQATSIGSQVFPMGFFVNGAIDFLGYHAEGKIDISANKGVSVQASMDPIVIGPGGLFSITAAQGKGGPQVSLSTFTQLDHPVVALRQPHFSINGAVALLGLKLAVLASVTRKGVQFELKGALAPGVDFDLDVEISGGALVVDGDIQAGIGTIDLGPLGKIRVDTQIEGSLGIRASATSAMAAVEGSFEFQGQDLDLGRLELDVKTAALPRLAETLTGRAQASLLAEFKDATRWANAVKDGLVDGVEDTAKVFKNVYGKSEKEAKEAAADIKKGANTAVKTANKGAKKFGKKLKKIF